MNKMGFGYLRLPVKDTQRKHDFDWDLLNEMTDRFISLGGRYFDTCCTYLEGYSDVAVRECLALRHGRSEFEVAAKLPGYYCKSYADCERFFNDNLSACGVDYFDVYLIHWLNREHYEKSEKAEAFRLLSDMKAAGKAKRIGFSYHDNAELLDEILTTHPEVDVVQLQINYVDWETAGIESRKCYETAVRHGKKVIVMEPLKGGMLARLPDEAKNLLRSIHPDWSMAKWAFAFVSSLPEVEIVLSGMNAMEQIEDNMSKFTILNDDEINALWQARDIIEKNTTIPCTGCHYCIDHCPKDIRIPDYFRMYNELMRYPNEDWKILAAYKSESRGYGKASDCIACKACEKFCPQGIKISENMKTLIAKTFDK